MSKPNTTRKARRIALLTLAVAGSGVALTSPAGAQTFTWIGTASSSWSIGANWQGGSPPAASGLNTYALRFNNSLANTYTATNDFAAGFLLNTLTFNSTSSGGTTVAGNSLDFRGANPGIVQSNYGGGTISQSFNISPDSGDFTISGSGLGSLSLTGQIAEGGGARRVVINTTPSVLNAQEIRLTGNNAFSGGLRLISGNLAIGNANALGTGAGTIDGGSVQQTTPVTVANNLTLNGDFQYIGAISGTFSGVLSGAGGVVHIPTGGSPQLSLTGANTYAGATTVDFPQVFTVNTPATGTLAIVGAAGRVSSTTINVRNSGTLQISDSTTAYTGGNPAGRIEDNATMHLRAGYVQLSATSAATATEAVGTLNLDGGHSVITLAPGTSAQANLNFGTLTRSTDRGTLFIRGNALGDTPAANVANVGLTNAPTLAGGGAGAGSPNISIIPFVFGDRSGVAGAGGSSTAGTVGFMTWDSGTQRLRLLNHTTEYVSSFGAVTGSTNNLLLTASANPTTPVTINSLFVRNSASQTIGVTGDTNTISFAAGNAAALYSTAGMTINTPLDFGGNEAVIFANSNTTINGKISGTNGITKVGSGGALTLTNTTNDFSGTITINGGTLAFGALSNLGATTNIVSGGGVVSNSGTHGRTRINYTGTGSITLPHDIRIASGLLELRSVAGTTLELSGVISGPGGLLLNQPGTIVLSGTNTYTGPTRFFGIGGDTIISSDANLGNGGVLDIGTTGGVGVTLMGNWTTSRQINSSSSFKLDTGTFNAAWNGVFTGNSAFEKRGAGRLSINGASPYTGAVTVTAGTLEVNGVLGPSANTVAIAAGAALGGTGTIYRTVTAAAGAIVSPGNSVGVLTANAITATGANFTYETATGGLIDRIDLIGALTVSSGSNLINLSGPYLPNGSYTLFNYASRTGTSIALGTTLGGPFTYTLNLNPTNIVLDVLQTGNDYNWDVNSTLTGPQDGSGTWTATVNVWDNILGVHASWADSVNNVMTFGAPGGGPGGGVSLMEARTAKSLRFVRSYGLNTSGGTPEVRLLDGITADATGVLNIPMTMLGHNTMNVAAGQLLHVGAGIAESGGAFNLTKVGAGTMLLAGISGYTGTTNINAGTFDLWFDVSISPATINMGGGTLLAGGPSDLTLSNVVTMTAPSGFAAPTGRTLTLNNSPTGAFGLTKVGAGTLVLPNGVAHTGTTAILEGTMDVTVAGTQTMTPTGAGTGALIKRGGGTLTINGTSTRSGDTTIAAGTLLLASGGGTFVVNGNVTVQPTAVFNINGQSNGPFTSLATTQVNMLSVNDGTVLMGAAANDYWVTSISMNGGTITGGGTSSDFHLFPGSGGINSGAFGSTAVVSLAGRLRLEGTTAKDFTVADGAPDVDLDITGSVLNGAVASPAPLGVINKLGPGTLRFTSSGNTFPGLNINGGRVLINGTNTGSIAVNTGGVLGGTGTNSGAVTVNSGGTLSPGASIGTLSTGTLTLASGSNFLVEADLDITGGTSADVVNVTGTVNVAGANLVFAFVPSVTGPITPNQTYVIIRNDAADAVTGTFANAPVGGVSNFLGALEFIVHYAFTGLDDQGFVANGNDVAVTFVSVPEPGALLGVVGLAIVALRRRRRAMA